MATIDEVTAKLRLDIAQFSKGLKDAQDQMDRFGKDGGKAVQSISQQLSGMASAFKGALAFAGISVGLQAIKQLATSVVDLGDELLKISDQTGISVETLSALNTVAVETDVSLGELGGAVQKMANAMGEAQRGAGDTADVFKALGISQQDLSAVSGDNAKALDLIAKHLATVTNDSNRMVLMQKIFGRSSRELTQFLQQLASEGLSEVERKARDAGLVIGRDFAVKADQFKDSLSRMGLTLQVLMVQVIGPAITMFNDLAAAIGLVAQTARQTQLNQVTDQIGMMEIGLKDLKRQAEKGATGGTWIDKLLGQMPGAAPTTGGAEAIQARIKASEDTLADARKLAEDLSKPLPPIVPPGPSRSGALPNVKDQAKAEEEAKKLEAALKKLDQEERLIPLQTALMGESFDEAGQRLKLFQDRLEFIVKFGTAPTAEAIAQMRGQFEQLVSQQELSTLDKQVRALDLSQGIFHDDLATGEAKIQAYRSAIDNLGTRIGAGALPQMKALTAQMNDQIRANAKLLEGQQIGEAYKAFALGLQQLNDEQAIFTDEGARATQTLQLYTTLFQALIKLGPAAAGGLAPVIAGMKQLQVPDLRTVLAPGERGAELFKGMPLEDFDPLAQKLADVRAELDKIRQNPSIDLHGQQVEDLKEKYKALKAEMRFGDMGHEAFGTFMQGFDDMLNGIVDGTETIGASFEKLAQRLIMDFTRRVLAEMFRPLDDAMINLARKLAQLGLEGVTGWFKGGGEAAPLAGATPAERSIFGAQHGGLFTKPTLAMLAEAGSPEVVMPKHAMDAWMKGVMQGVEPGGTAVQVNVINNAPGTKATTQQKTDPQGNRSLDILIDEAVAQQLTRSGSASQRALRSVYGSSQVLTGR